MSKSGRWWNQPAVAGDRRGRRALARRGSCRTGGILAILALGMAPTPARADPPADVFLDTQEPGTRAALMAIVGPGLRASVDHRIEIEKQMSELRLQAYGDLVFPYSEASLHADLRLFLLTFGASVGYHDEWRLLSFDPDYTQTTDFGPGAGYAFGRDVGGARGETDAAGALADADGEPFGPVGDTELSRSLRRDKEQNADIGEATWGFVEGRTGFYWPAQGFLFASSTALRFEARPDQSYDWQLATVLDGGLHVRSENYAFFRDPRLGFFGPAVRVVAVQRRELTAALETTVPTAGGGTAVVRTARAGDACQQAAAIPCGERWHWELHYGVIGGLRTGWIHWDDVLLIRAFTTLGFENRVFGTHLFGAPLSLLFAYEVTVLP